MNLQEALKVYWKLVTFRASEQEFADYRSELFLFGILSTWLVGIGRYWDDPTDVSLIHRLGLGSIIYIVVFGFLLWIVAKPFINSGDGPIGVVGLIGCAALPGIVYAFPIEMITGNELAYTYNYIAVVVVSTYRVFFLIWAMKRILATETGHAIACGLLILALIVSSLAFLNTIDQVFGMMGGLREGGPSESVLNILHGLGIASIVALPFLIYLYVRLVAAEGGYFN